MTNRHAASTITALILVSCLSGVVLANDAGSGGDAGGTTSTAVWLPATDATYYGNLTFSANGTGDDEDYYGVNMSNNTGIAVQIDYPSSTDFDLALLNSGGGYIDTSVSTGTTDAVTSNGTSVGGNTVYIWVDRYSGSGQYTMQIWIFSTNSSGGGGGGGGNSTQNDANTGGDASDVQATPTFLNATNATYYGFVDNSADEYDWYAISMPAFHSINASLSWNTSSVDLDLHLFDENGSYIDYSYWDNPENVSSGNAAIGGTNVTLMVRAWSGSDNYTLTLNFSNISSSPVYNQDDAGTGDDASDDYNNPTNIVTYVGQNDFTGWASSSADAVDEYSTSIPVDHGITVSLSFDTSDANFDLAMADMQINIIDSSSSWFSSPEEVTTNGSGYYVGGDSVIIEVYASSGEGDYNMTIWIFTLDADGDGFYDEDEVACGSDPDDASSVPQDTDADGICDILDDDDDDDGYDDANDSFPLDNTEWDDTDGDGVGDNSDEDDDNDGWTDSDEYQCGTDSLDYNSQPLDTDSDGTCDIVDTDDDDDGYPDASDAFPLDDEEWMDTDGDGTGDNADLDDDGDGFTDATEGVCGSDPLDSGSIPLDTDQDGSCNAVDGDDDNDGFADINDAFPLDANEWVDTDGDGFGNNQDQDDDGDFVIDTSDAFPLDATEWDDNDADGVGDNADLDDDNDGWPDTDEADCQTDPFSSFSVPDDFDSDQICDRVDPDDDGDGVDDTLDMFQFDATEWEDLDLDGIGDNADTDDDGDSWSDLEEPNCGSDPRDANSIPDDWDGDRICDPLDPDDDNDMTPDIDDDFPFDSSESVDTDGDGVGDNSDSDDDGDEWPDAVETICQTMPLSANSVPLDTDGDGSCDVVDADDDNDGVSDLADVFPLDGTEWEDRNSDGLGDNAHPLTIVDHMKLNPMLTALAILAILGAIGGSVAFTLSRKQEGAIIVTDGTEQVWDDDESTNKQFTEEPEAPVAPDPPERPPEMPKTPPSPPEKPPMPPEMPPQPELEPEQDSDSVPPSPPKMRPPPPPGFEDMASVLAAEPERVNSWEDLPDGGDYVETEPMRYEGEDCGVWVRQDDDSWVREN